MDEKVLKQIREEMEQQILDRQIRAEPITSLGNEFIRNYLLLKILDRLESIDESLTSMSSDSWDDHHNK